MPYIKNPSFHPHPQLSRLVAPLPARKRRELEHRLSRCSHSTPIRIWKNYILVDFESYDYCLKHKITVDVSYLAFRSEEEATIWICKNQYNREDIPSWIGSIQRAERNSDFSKITERAREKLISELINLIHIADNTIILLKEKRHG